MFNVFRWYVICYRIITLDESTTSYWRAWIEGSRSHIINYLYSIQSYLPPKISLLTCIGRIHEKGKIAMEAMFEAK